MEEILSSIKRIIAEEGDTMPGRSRRQPRPMPSAVDRDPAYLDGDADDDEILELLEARVALVEGAELHDHLLLDLA